MDREQTLADALNRLGTQNMFNETSSGHNSLIVHSVADDAVWDRRAHGRHVPIPYWCSSLSQGLAYDHSVDISIGDSKPFEVYVENRGDAAPCSFEVESCFKLIDEGDLVSAEIFAHRYPSVTIHHPKCEAASRSESVGINTRRVPKRFEARA